MADPILDSLARAVENEPQNLALRVHLAELLLDAKQPEAAAHHARHALAQQPDHLGALKVAADACLAIGDASAAQSYRRLLDALTPRQTEPPMPRGEEPGVVKLLADSAAHASAEPWTEEPKRVTLADVAGMDHVKRRIELAFLGPLRNPAMMQAYGKTARGGLLLYGPPGCGKTYLARAIAGELGARFFSVGIAEVLDMYIGQSERNLKALFDAARHHAPCVLFFDELDALGRKRSLRRDSSGRDLVNLMLSELDGISSSNAGVFVLAATNHPWDIDSALRRPGRLDRMVLVLPPDRDARRTLIEHTLRGKPAESIDTAWLADKTEHFSGADLVHLCDAAVELALEDSLKSGQVRPIRTDDFKRVLRDVKPSTTTWMETARNYVLFANEGGAYDDLLPYLKSNKIL